MNRNRAFTLIELLVVIAIIAILAAILFPVFAQAKAAAKKAAAISNAKQIVLGVMMYQNDYDDVMPIASSYDTAIPSGNQGFPFLLSPYIQKVNNTSAGAANPNDTNTLWRDPADSVAAQPFSGQFGGTPTNLKHQSFVPIFFTSGVDPANRAAWGPLVTEGTFNYLPGKSGGAFESPAGTFILAETSNPSSIIGSNFAGVKRPWDPAVSTFTGNPPGVTISPTGNYGGQDCTYAVNTNGGSDYCRSVIDKTKPSGFHTDGWVYGYADGHAKHLKAVATVGKGVNNGQDKAGQICSVVFPCGGWTLDGND